MLTTSLLIAASSIPLAFSAPIRRAEGKSFVSRAAAASYQVFGGDGTMGQGWPSSSNWLSFDDLWTINMPILKSSCTQYLNSPRDNNDAEINGIKKALDSTASASGLDSRYLLAVMMQESKGCVRAPTTNYGENNPGLFQSFNGLATCNPDNKNFVIDCPDSTIKDMVMEGAGLNGRPFGLTQAIAQSGASDDSKYFKGARIYNSGSVAAGGNLGAGIATHCYASDIANRLVGWPSDQSHASSCQEASIGSVQGSSGSYSGNNGNTNQPTENEGQTQDPPKDEPETPPATETPAPSNNDSSAPKAEGYASNCNSWYTVKDGDNCSNLSVSFDTLRQLNSKLDGNCSNLWKGYAYCVGT